jgi:hypothetical protein
VVDVQRGQGGKQACFLAQSRALRWLHLDLPAFLYLGVWEPERPMHGDGVNKLETRVQILELFQGANLVLLTKT